MSITKENEQAVNRFQVLKYADTLNKTSEHGHIEAALNIAVEDERDALLLINECVGDYMGASTKMERDINAKLAGAVLIKLLAITYTALQDDIDEEKTANAEATKEEKDNIYLHNVAELRR